jgi:hypothetical protein
MGQATDALKDFIDTIPDAKLQGLRHQNGTIHQDGDFRLDMQSVS